MHHRIIMKWNHYEMFQIFLDRSFVSLIRIKMVDAKKKEYFCAGNLVSISGKKKLIFPTTCKMMIEKK